MNTVLKAISVFALLISSPLLFAQTQYHADWESLKTYGVPEWYKDMKFGIYFHWGPYSVPAYKEWYSKHMYDEGHEVRAYHEKTYGPLNEFGYKDFIPMFTAEKFNAEEWVDLFVKAGAQFAGPVAEHADGFAMWDSDLTKWDAKDMGPHRDIVGEMAKAIKARGLKFIATNHRQWLYAWYPTWDNNTDAGDPQYAGLYGPYAPKGAFEMAVENYKHYPDDAFQKDWLNRLNELMDKYQPDIMWFDNKLDIIDATYRKQFLADFYNKSNTWGKKVVCTYKFNDFAKGTAVLDLERSRMSTKKDFTWLTDDSIDWESWCYIKNARYKSTNRLIDFLVDVVSKNGAVLLNINPTAQGVIPAPVRERLLAMGEWLQVNGEAIYGTRTWKIYGEGPQKIIEGHLSEFKNAEAVAEDIRYTTKGDALYAISLDWPQGKAIFPALKKNSQYYPQKIKSVMLLGHKGKLKFSQTNRGLEVTLPQEKPGEHAFVFKVLAKK